MAHLKSRPSEDKLKADFFKKAAEIFNMYDVDNSGQLEFDELAIIQANIWGGAKEDVAKKLASDSAWDHDGDDQIGVTEFSEVNS